jgi:ribosomal protein L30E
MKTKLRIGDRVKLTKEGRDEAILHRNNKTGLGTVTGKSFLPDCVSIREDGAKRSARYHVSFWEPI